MVFSVVNGRRYQWLISYYFRDPLDELLNTNYSKPSYTICFDYSLIIPFTSLQCSTFYRFINHKSYEITEVDNR